MDFQLERRGWGIACEETGEKLFLLGTVLRYPGQQDLRPEIEATYVPCSAGFRHEHVATRENLLWLRQD
jgi:hypothetical protein